MTIRSLSPATSMARSQSATACFNSPASARASHRANQAKNEAIEKIRAQVKAWIADKGVDVVMMLRIQLERQSGGFFPTLREYSIHFGLNRRRLEMANDDVIVLHPGPINRGVEIDSDVVDGPYSLILDQVNNGVAVRMAVLYLLAGGD